MKNKIVAIPIFILMLNFCVPQVAASNNYVLPNIQKTSNLIMQFDGDTITFKTFQTESGWGYDIYMNGKLYVHQPNIPAVIGNRGFSKQKQAEKTARFVIEKIKKQIFPPTVTLEELKSLKVLN